MKKLITILFICLLQTSFATTYYVSNNGSDANTGTSISTTWQTLAKVNSATFYPGDNILFNRGDTFYGRIIVGQSGTSSNPITIGAYGTGTNPIITGFTDVTTWTNEGGGIFSSTVTATSPNVTIGMLNGRVVMKGRYPNSGFFYFQSHIDNTSITSDSLSGVINWTGAELVSKKVNWIIDRNIITNQNANTLTVSTNNVVGNNDSYPFYDGGWFFIQNDLRTLDTIGEWYFSNNKLNVYFGATPTAMKISTLAYNIDFGNNQYLIVDSLDLTGAGVKAISFSGASNITIRNVTSRNQGGFTAQGSVSKVLMSKVNIINSLAGGIKLQGNDKTISDCTIDSVAIGIGNLWGGDGSGSSGISLKGDRDTIRNCVVTNTGYLGIDVFGTDVLVDRNYIYNFCIVKSDGGGIYTSGDVNKNVKITNNIVRTGLGVLFDKSDYTGGVNGIYLDNFANTGSVIGNTITDVKDAAIRAQYNSHHWTIDSNTIYNVPVGIRYSSTLLMEEFANTNIIRQNIFALPKIGQFALIFKYSTVGQIDSIGEMDNNYYLNVSPAIAADTVRNLLGWVYRKSLTIPQWQTFSGKDMNSTFMVKTESEMISDLRFEYNATKSPTTVSLLPYKYIDVRNNIYDGSITLQPFTSAVLIKDGPATMTGLTENELDLVTIAPNPSSDYIQVNVGENNSIDAVQIISLEGQTVAVNMTKIDSHTSKINVSSVAKGTYFIRLTTEKGQMVKKIIVQ